MSLTVGSLFAGIGGFGNSIVPQIAEWIFQKIDEAERRRGDEQTEVPMPEQTEQTQSVI